MAPARTGLALFALLFASHAFFHQGGGWNQNVRYAQVRALAQGELAIDDQLFHDLETRADGTTGYHAVSLRANDASRRLPRAVSLDLSTRGDHLYPNKPPGLSLLAVPGHVLTNAILRAAGSDPAASRSLDLALYGTTVLSVGLLAALGGLAFQQVARRLFPEVRASSRLAATLAYALGTPVFAYATFLIDHAVVASLALFTLLAVLAARDEDAHPARRLFLAGTLAGVAVAVNHSAALLAIAFGVYVLATRTRWSDPLAYACGGVLPALLLGGYQWLCFGHPLDLPQDHQLAMFQTASPLLGIFGRPRPELLPRLLVMPYRGLLFWSPVLVPALIALGAMLVGRTHRPVALLVLAVFVTFLLMNASFNAWHGGGTYGPRYLLPAVPLLALPLVLAFERARALTTAFAVVSVAITLLVTAVSPQLEANVYRPLTAFYLPLARGDTVTSGAYTLQGPVSVHPVGYVGAGLESLDPNGATARWSSFNLGEALVPHSAWSLAPLLALWAAAGLWLRRRL